jgi:hypothetical protein
MSLHNLPYCAAGSSFATSGRQLRNGIALNFLDDFRIAGKARITPRSLELFVPEDINLTIAFLRICNFPPISLHRHVSSLITCTGFKALKTPQDSRAAENAATAKLSSPNPSREHNKPHYLPSTSVAGPYSSYNVRLWVRNCFHSPQGREVHNLRRRLHPQC